MGIFWGNLNQIIQYFNNGHKRRRQLHQVQASIGYELWALPLLRAPRLVQHSHPDTVNKHTRFPYEGRETFHGITGYFPPSLSQGPWSDQSSSSNASHPLSQPSLQPVINRSICELCGKGRLCLFPVFSPLLSLLGRRVFMLQEKAGRGA